LALFDFGARGVIFLAANQYFPGRPSQRFCTDVVVIRGRLSSLSTRMITPQRGGPVRSCPVFREPGLRAFECTRGPVRALRPIPLGLRLTRRSGASDPPEL